MSDSDYSDSDCTASSDGNHPHTPPRTALLSRTKTGRSFTAPSKFPKPKTTALYPQSRSQPQTPSSPTVSSAPLDWGGGEWSRLVEDIKRKSPETREETEEDLLLGETLLEDPMQSAMMETPTPALQPAISFASTSNTGPSSASHNKESPMPAHIDEFGSNQPHMAVESRDDDNPDYYTSDSDNSVITRGSAKSTAGSSPQTVLRGLIRDAHREMMYFTLPNARFSLGDLRQGLDYAFAMLQLALSKLAILAVLHDDMTDVSAVQLRSWIDHIDHLDPQTHYEPRMLVMFESLSAGEIQIALAEMVQSRLIVEGEVKRLKALLAKRLTVLESNATDTAWLSAAGNAFDKTNEDESQHGMLVDDGAWDRIFTSVMIVILGTLYLCLK